MRANGISLALLNQVLDISKADRATIIANKNEVKVLAQSKNYYVTGINTMVDVSEPGSLTIDKDFIKMFPKYDFVNIKDKVISTQDRSLTINRVLDNQVAEIEINEKIAEFERLTFDEFVSNIYAVAQDETRPILQGIHFGINQGVLETCALDGYRMAVRKLELIRSDKSIGSMEFTIHSDVINAVNKIKSNRDIYIYKNKDFVRFGTDYLYTTSKLLEGKFVNYNSLIPQYFRTRIKVDASELLKLLKSYKSRIVKFSIKSEEMLITATIEKAKSRRVTDPKTHKQVTEHYFETIAIVNDKFPCKWQGEPIEIAFNPKYFIDALKDKKDEVEIKFTSAISPIVIEQDDKTELILPVRLVK